MGKMYRIRNMHAHIGEPPCHVGPVEVIKNLFCGGEDEALAMASAPIQVDLLVAFDRICLEIRNSGFQGELVLYPIKDFGTLSNKVLTRLATKIIDKLHDGKKVGMYCVGGHGRTGYVASIVLGQLGYDDPIKYLRTNYCKNAVESDEQVKHIASYLSKPELVGMYVTHHSFAERSDILWHGCNDYYTLTTFKEWPDMCGDCAWFKTMNCPPSEYLLVNEDDFACEGFRQLM